MKRLRIRNGLLLLVLCVACSSTETKEPARRSDDERRTQKASDRVPGYDGKPVVHPASTKKKEPELRIGRTIYYVTVGRTRVVDLGQSIQTRLGNKTAQTLVFTDSSPAYIQKNAPDMPRPSGKSWSDQPSRMDAFIADLEAIGIKTLDYSSGPLGASIGPRRAIHLELDGRRRSIYKEALDGSGGMASPRGVFRRCEDYLIGVMQGKSREQLREEILGS